MATQPLSVTHPVSEFGTVPPKKSGAALRKAVLETVCFQGWAALQSTLPSITTNLRAICRGCIRIAPWAVALNKEFVTRSPLQALQHDLHSPNLLIPNDIIEP